LVTTRPRLSRINPEPYPRLFRLPLSSSGRNGYQNSMSSCTWLRSTIYVETTLTTDAFTRWATSAKETWSTELTLGGSNGLELLIENGERLPRKNPTSAESATTSSHLIPRFSTSIVTSAPAKVRRADRHAESLAASAASVPNPTFDILTNPSSIYRSVIPYSFSLVWRVLRPIPSSCAALNRFPPVFSSA